MLRKEVQQRVEEITLDVVFTGLEVGTNFRRGRKNRATAQHFSTTRYIEKRNLPEEIIEDLLLKFNRAEMEGYLQP